MTLVRAGRASPPKAVRYTVVRELPWLRAVVAAHAISMFGTVAADSALSLLMYRETKSSLYAALAFSVVFVPQAISGALLGGFTGRYTTRTVLVGANAAGAFLAAAMASPWTPVGWQLALATVLGAVAPIHDGARTAMLIDALEHDQFLAMRSALRMIAQLAVVSGFACGGTLSVVAGPRVVLLGNAASFVLATLLVCWATAGAPECRSAAERRTSPVVASLRAVAQVFRQRSLRLTALRLWLPASFAAAGTGLTVAYANEIGQGGTAVGLLLAAFAGGLVLGEIILSRISAQARRRSAASLILLTQLPTLGFAASPQLYVAIGLRVLSGGGFAYMQLIDSELAQRCDRGMRRQVMIVVSSGAMACQGIAIAVAGALAQVGRPTLVIAGSGACGTMASLAVLRRRDRPRSPPA